MNFDDISPKHNPWGDFTRDSHFFEEWAATKASGERQRFHTVPWAPGMEQHQLSAVVYRHLYHRCVALRALATMKGVNFGELRWHVTIRMLAGEIRAESAALIVALGMLEDSYA